MSSIAFTPDEEQQSLAQVIGGLCETPEDCNLTLGEVAEGLGSRAFGAVLFGFGVINALPLPPGSTIVLGVPLLLIAPQVAFGAQSLWLPGFLRRRQLRGPDLHRLFGRVLPGIARIDRLSRPRLSFMVGPVGQRIIGVICAVLAFIIILPIPFGNLAPSLTVTVLSAALFQRDGLLALIGHAMALASFLILALTAGALWIGIQQLLRMFGG